MTTPSAKANPPARRLYTVAEYLRMERDADVKHEYRDGEIVAMAGGSFEHNLVGTNIAGELRARLKGGPCVAINSDQRVRVQGTPLYVYPDATVVCGPVRFDAADDGRQTVLNPKVVVEVLSPTTQAYDRVDKFDRYLRIDALEQIVYVAQDRPHVRTFTRREGGTWLLRAHQGLDAVVRLDPIGVELPLAEIYAGVSLGTSHPARDDEGRDDD